MERQRPLTRISGWEDEFRITDGARTYTLEDLLPRSQRPFFAQLKHALVGERKPILSLMDEDVDISDYDTTMVNCVWTWYGGKLYDEQDGLVEACTPPVRLSRSPVEHLAHQILVGRAQLAELAAGLKVDGMSSQLNVMLDAEFQGADLCNERQFADDRVPTQGMTRGRAQKLGADLGKILVRTVGPVVAYLFFTSTQRKGAIYRPRGHRRLELTLPFVARNDQIVAGALFWFAAVEHTTRLIKEDLSRYGDGFAAEFRQPDYYERILARLPVVVQEVKLKTHVSFRLGYEVNGGYEAQIMDQGSDAVIATNLGPLRVADLAEQYLQLFGREIANAGRPEHRRILEDFISGARIPSVDLKRPHRHISLPQYIRAHLPDGPTAFLERLPVDPQEYPLAALVQEPTRWAAGPPGSRTVRRNLGDYLEWHLIRMEVIAEDAAAGTVQVARLEIPRDDLAEYLRLERAAHTGERLWEIAQRWAVTTQTLPYPRQIFTYGTFMSEALVQRTCGVAVVRRQEARLPGTLYDLGSFPVLVESFTDRAAVHGFLIEVDDFDQFLREADLYEGAMEPAPYFLRVVRQVTLSDGSTALAWAYLGNANHPEIRECLAAAHALPSGHWTPPEMAPSTLRE
ncbi:MAG: gamma-glutamylcyclotransferase [Chloroflexi bacterium]|nr:gamma-glutamylcyclotransferase [Chloroflexota bacterium]